MKPFPSSSVIHAPPLPEQEEILRHMPVHARTAFEQFQAEGDPAMLDHVVIAILEDFIPRTPVTPLTELPGSTLMISDLGFDSLSITEVVFFAEDLFGITISNQEIIRVRTLDDLRGFIRLKVTGRAMP